MLYVKRRSYQLFTINSSLATTRIKSYSLLFSVDTGNFKRLCIGAVSRVTAIFCLSGLIRVDVHRQFCLLHLDSKHSKYKAWKSMRLQENEGPKLMNYKYNDILLRLNVIRLKYFHKSVQQSQIVDFLNATKIGKIVSTYMSPKVLQRQFRLLATSFSQCAQSEILEITLRFHAGRWCGLLRLDSYTPYCKTDWPIALSKSDPFSVQFWNAVTGDQWSDVLIALIEL